MVRGGWAIGVPLTMLQWGIHRNTGVLLDPTTVANNFLVGNAIYDADRIVGPVWSPNRTTTHVTTALSCAYYASDERTWPLVPVVVGLHFGYTAVKPSIAAVKPFVVALLWTIAIYYVPLWRSDVHVATDVLSPAALFLSITSLSHAGDVVDLKEDSASGVLTPAVRMGRDEAIGYVIACVLASAFLRAQSPHAVDLYDVVSLAFVAGVTYESWPLAVGLAAAFTAQFVQHYDVEILGQMLRSTEWSHRAGIAALVETVEHARCIPHPVRKPVVDGLFSLLKFGDDLGGRFLDVYHHAVRGRL